VARTLLSAALGLAVALFADRADPERVEGRVRATPKIKRASGFLRTQDARAALPQNCSMGNVRLSGESENGTRVPNLSHQSASR